MVKLSEAQRNILRHLISDEWSLHQSDEGPRRWFLRHKDGFFSRAHAAVAESLYGRKLIALTSHEGGWPGVDGYSITPAGRRILSPTEERGNG